MTQEVLSGFADIARGHLAMIERGERKPTLETLYRISCALEVKMSAIIMDIEKELEQKD
jgi:transcriptional regulator with XRE-family HTH domain